MSETAKVLQVMLTENTGVHLLDSGGAYGRSWQQNKGRDFAGEPAATISVQEGYIDIRRSTYHFLKECLKFDEAMTLGFEQFCKVKDPKDRIPWLPLMEEFVESGGYTGIYGEGAPLTINTYNHDSLLDQVIQYVYFELDEKGYVLLHLGSKLHTAYTAPKAFRCNIESSPSIFDDGRAEVFCKGKDHRWYVEEGNWDVDHYKSTDERTLDDFPIVNASHKVLKRGKEVFGDPIVRILWQDDDGVHCPLCGEALEVW